MCTTDHLHNPGGRGDIICKTLQDSLLTCDLPYGKVGHLSELLYPILINIFLVILYSHLPPYSYNTLF